MIKSGQNWPNSNHPNWLSLHYAHYATGQVRLFFNVCNTFSSFPCFTFIKGIAVIDGLKLLA